MSKPIYFNFFSSTLSALNDQILNSDPNDPDRLYLTYNSYASFSEQDINDLLNLLDNPNIQIAALDLFIPLELISTEKFKQLVKKLDPQTLHYLTLDFPEGTSRAQVNATLLESGIADLAFYPISISYPWSKELDKTFIKKIIHNVREYKQSPQSASNKKASKGDADLPKIKLKEIISNQTLKDNENLVSIDVAIEAEAQVEVEVEVEVEVAIESHIAAYNGPKYDYSKFKHCDKYRIARARNHSPHDVQYIQQELFAQLPCAIQYVTPAAASKLHADFSQFMSFNTENLPPGMFLQKTPEGALVLDYDLGYERSYNWFTPLDNLKYDEEEHDYYAWSLLPEDFQEHAKWPFYRENLPYLQHDVFVNLYVRDGKDKLCDFIQLFHVVNPEENKALANCINAVFRCYVCSFHQCDFMAKGSWFVDCIQRIKQEQDATKLDCLTSLLTVSQRARHDLQHTLDAFDVFWEKIKTLCPEGQLDKIKFTQLTHDELIQTAAIPPVVAMERLLTILQNSCDVGSQVDYLSEISSGVYRTYYASAFEGFHMVHKDMDISWTPNVHSFQYLTEWPSNLSYFKNMFILLNDELFYITHNLDKVPVPFTTKKTNKEESLFENHGKDYIAQLKQKKFLQIPQEYLFFLTEYYPGPIPFNQHAKVYQVDLSTLRDMALQEEIIYYPKFYAFLHRYLGQQSTGISYADFRKQTEDCGFQHRDKVIAFVLLFFITDVNYDAELGIRLLITRLKQLKPNILTQLAETLYKLHGRGVVLNNQEGLIILDELLTKNPQEVLEALSERKLIITEYDDILNKYKRIAIGVKTAIKANQIDVNQVPTLLNTLQNFSEEHQVTLYQLLQAELQDNLESLCENITKLRVAALPPEYIIHYIRLRALDCGVLIERFAKDQHDPILAFILSPHFTGTNAEAKKLLELTTTSQHKHKIVALLKKHNMLQYVDNPVVLTILAKSHDTLLPGQKLSPAAWQELTQLLSAVNNHDGLMKLYNIAAPNSICLLNALKTNQLDMLEREPFGARDDVKHFEVSQVERVINESVDWSNNTVYSYKYRKQLMEAFTFVNEIGYQLPIFTGKTVKELSNTEIQSCFLGLKDKSILQDFPIFQQQLIALALIREALYRSTGQMAYSTQLIAIIDCLMHPGHVISNIDTGQGKSLIDMAKSALLWLNSDRVDLTTSSIADAKRDLENFSPFLCFLNIPHGKKPITTQSESTDFVPNGINTSTFAQMSLFQAKMKMLSHPLGQSTDVVSLIVNESDYSLLEDRTVYRYASQSTQGLNHQTEWVFTAINEFVLQPKFTAKNTSLQDDLTHLKDFLKIYAKEHNKKSNMISEITSEQWLRWIDAALMVQYKLKTNIDFIIPEEQQAVTIRGKKQMSHVVKLLMSEGKVKTKVSEDAKFGNAVQQLLYAKLNQEYPEKKFVIEPETNTILSSNNKTMIDGYLKRKNPGLIWGSSGTVGSVQERKELHAKYNIDFSKIAPHQAKKTQLHEAKFLKNKKVQFEAIANKMAEVKLDNKAKPQLIFCKDINSAIKLHQLLAKTHPDNLQIYTGGDNEATCVAKAALGGMITVCTAAIGRNTDILYDRSLGMDVTHTSVNSFNLEAQLTGRTGRQGSAGDINFYFNEQELGGKTKEKVQEEIYQNSLKDRAFNEEIYSILGNVLTQLEQQITQPNTIDFLNNTWAKLSIKYEKRYKELNLTEQYNREAFIDEIVTELKGYNLNQQEILHAVTHQFQAKKPYNPYTTAVKLTDCHPPVELAYALLNKDKAQPSLTAAAKKQIKDKVLELLKDYKNSKQVKYHADYINYLCKTDAAQHEIRAIHQECLKEFLSANTSRPWYKRWFGCQSLLNKAANSASYLILFRSLLSVPHAVQDKKTELDMAKSAAIALVREYQSLWFINNERKKMSEKLIQDIAQADHLAALITFLDNYQIQLAKKDSETNKKRCWFPLHKLGSSRLQDTLSSALNLASSLHDKPTDNYEALGTTVDLVDKNNKKVLKKQIKSAVMLREHSIFSSQTKQDNQDDLGLDNALKK